MKIPFTGDVFGRIAAPPKVRATKDGGKQFISLRLNRLNDLDGAHPVWVSSFHGVEVYASVLEEGDIVHVSGAVDLHEWTDQAGQHRAALKIVAGEITLALTEPKLKAKVREKKAPAAPVPGEAEASLPLAAALPAGECQAPTSIAPASRGKRTSPAHPAMTGLATTALRSDGVPDTGLFQGPAAVKKGGKFYDGDVFGDALPDNLL